MNHQTAPHPPLQAAHPLPPVYGSITFTHLKENFCMVKLPYLCKKSKGKTCMVGEPSHVKQLSLNNVCEIGLKGSHRMGDGRIFIKKTSAALSLIKAFRINLISTWSISLDSACKELISLEVVVLTWGLLACFLSVGWVRKIYRGPPSTDCTCALHVLSLLVLYMIVYLCI